MRRTAVGALVTVLLVSACASQGPAGASARFAGRAGATALPATAPYLSMTGGSSGYAVWPSGGSWVLLQTSDGFAHVVNRTPVGVDTEGGLIGSFGPTSAAVAVGAHDRLVRSPVLVASGNGAWVPDELPAAVVDARDAVSLASGKLTAVTTGGDVVARTSSGWAVLTGIASLSPAARLRLDGVTWADATTGWVTGQGPAGPAMAYRTTDAGRTWAGVPGSAGTAVAALVPCGAGKSWLMPVIDAAGTVTVLRTSDGGITWTRGSALHLASGQPAWACAGPRIWMTARASGSDRIFASTDGGRSWLDRGPPPRGLTALAITGPGVGFAASAGSVASLWAVSDDGTHFTPITLPGWVATIGAQSGGD
ncbi:MAG: Photosynthesis system assembly factor [Pseudonocardiales bacterium]|nr:Photosynthesis system assembly factor [Pseudonocardiales bacterium]